jgi:gamma-glutamylcyclotransferase
MATSDDNNTTNTTLYFGYGSNLWRHQMHNRCPNSTYLGIARLNNFKWIINERGYANVVEVEEPTRQNADDQSYTAFDEEATKWKGNYETQVWGLVYSLQASDEARLDRNEGVPFAYAKEMMGCDFWPVNNNHHGHEDHEDQSSMPAHVTGKKPEKRDMLVYINRNAVTPSEPKEEYVYRMNMGIRDAVKEGVPEGYVMEVMRRFIPEVKGEEEVR